LHCFNNKPKHQYIKNLLKNVELKPGKPIARFELEHNEKEFFIEFLFVTDEVSDVFLLEDLQKNTHKEIKELKEEVQLIEMIFKSFEKNKNIDFVKRKLGKVAKNYEIYEMIKNIKTFSDSRNIMNNILADLKNKINKLGKSNSDILLEANKKKVNFEKVAKNEKLFYILHFDYRDNVKGLMYRTNADEKTVKIISNKIFLAAPSSQIFLFLTEKEKKSAFDFHEDFFGNYLDNIESSQKKLTGLFTYTFKLPELIIKYFEKAKDKDFAKALKNEKYGNSLQKIIKELSYLFADKTVTVNPELSKIIFKLKGSNKELLPEDLSHGELRKLAIFIWLRYNSMKDCIILMDEIENGLHPDWQFEIIKELEKWAGNNQFILATHSYELCQAVTPSHVKEIEPKLIK